MAGPPTLYQLQVLQKRHDLEFHPDIFYLPYPSRMKHFVFHFAKYMGRLADVTPHAAKRREMLELTLVDSFIVTLAASDVLKVNFDEQLERMFGRAPTRGAKGWMTVVDAAGANAKVGALTNWWLKRLARPVGKMAKALESLDHMEPIDVKKMLTEGLMEVLVSILIVAHQLHVDLVGATKRRWKDIEKRRIL